MAHLIDIHPTPGTWVIRAGGAIIGETNRALELVEGDYTPVIYFPRADLGMAFLEQTDHTTYCPHKGQATYYTITTAAEQFINAAWSYEAPFDGVATIKDHVAFYTDRITVERL
mgnify:FL=1